MPTATSGGSVCLFGFFFFFVFFAFLILWLVLVLAFIRDFITVVSLAPLYSFAWYRSNPVAQNLMRSQTPHPHSTWSTDSPPINTEWPLVIRLLSWFHRFRITRFLWELTANIRLFKVVHWTLSRSYHFYWGPTPLNQWVPHPSPADTAPWPHTWRAERKHKHGIWTYNVLGMRDEIVSTIVQRVRSQLTQNTIKSHRTTQYPQAKVSELYLSGLYFIQVWEQKRKNFEFYDAFPSIAWPKAISTVASYSESNSIMSRAPIHIDRIVGLW